MRILTPSRKRAGFTLMEIMVVIIVIAVLASVAGPMIGSITDQGRASATKAQMTNIKTALVNYKSDVGHYPHNGNGQTNTNVNLANDAQMGTDVSNNVLVNNNAIVSDWYGITNAMYQKRWKGPYMDSDPSDFMSDGWGAKIRYLYDNKQLWLRSFGPDLVEDTTQPCLNVSKDVYTGDDIVAAIAKVNW